MSVQLFGKLDVAIEAALRASIERFGVLVPVVRDQDGRTLDGHHRSRIAEELGISYRVDVREVSDEEEALEIARTLNADRRHLTTQQRREVVKALREDGHSVRAIAGALGAGKSTVFEDVAELSASGQLDAPARSTGLDGKSRPATKPKPPSAPAKRGYRRDKDTPFEISHERAQLVAEANKRRLIDGLSQINGLLRGLLDLDYGIIAAALSKDEVRTWSGKAAEQARSLKQLERRMKEAAANGG